MKYRLFINDAGRDGYSALLDIAGDTVELVQKAARRRMWPTEKGIILPLHEKPHWPDTGKTPPTSEQLLGVPGASAVPVLQEGTGR